jgi:O-antigen ligase
MVNCTVRACNPALAIRTRSESLFCCGQPVRVPRPTSGRWKEREGPQLTLALVLVLVLVIVIVLVLVLVLVLAVAVLAVAVLAVAVLAVAILATIVVIVVVAPVDLPEVQLLAPAADCVAQRRKDDVRTTCRRLKLSRCGHHTLAGRGSPHRHSDDVETG